MPARRLLIVAYPFPPMPTIGANRWDAMARHLRRLGNDVTIVTTSAFGRIRDPDEERYVRRAGDLTSSPKVRSLFRRGPLPPPRDASASAANAADAADAASQSTESPLPDRLRTIFVPDLYIATWVPQALRLARRVVEEESIECVVTTSPYESTHLLGPPLRRHGVALIADFRDGWSFEPHRPPFPTAAQRGLDQWMERRVVLGADRVVTATRSIADDLERRFGIDAVHIPNGFDPFLHRELPPLALPPLGDDAVVVAHTGKLAGVANRDPRGLFAAIRQLRAEDPVMGRRLRLVLAGRLDSEDARLVGESGLDDQIIWLGERPHAESLALQRRADALILIASAEGSEATGKLFEYLSSGRPIIALAGSEVARIVASTGTGVTVRADDASAIAAQLRRVIAGELQQDYRPAHLEPYVYPGPAERVAAVIEDALATRSGR